MGLDAKVIQVFLWRILKFSSSICYRFVQKHPFVSSILLLFFLLYKFLPSIFLFLIYTSPFLVCTAVFLRIYYSSESPKIQNVKEDEKENLEISSTKSESTAADLIINRNDNSSTQSQKSRRRNVKGKNKDWDAHVCKKERDMVFLTTCDHDLIGKTALIEEKPQVIIEEKESQSLNRRESSSWNASAVEDIQTLDEHCPVLDSEASKTDFLPHNSPDEQSDKSNDGGFEEAESSEEADDDEEEAQEDGNTAVEWTEDDEKNLMDLGISEIERNRRLESLIAKRSARKLLRMQMEKSLIDMDSVPPGQIAPIFVSRSNPNAPNYLHENEDLLMPGSAPSVLLPARNPFDLPYDPHEEKPNLMGDSFHQEFMAAHQKEISFCRHESFCLGPFPGEPKQERHNTKLSPFIGTEKRASEGPGFSRFRRQSDNGELDQLVEQLLFQAAEAASHVHNAPSIVEQEGQAPNQVINSVELKHEEDRKTKKMENCHDMELRSGNGSEFQMEPDTIKDNGSESGLSFSSEENKIFNANRANFSENLEPTAGKIPEEFGNPVQNSFTCSIPEGTAVKEPLYDSSPSAYDNTRSEDRLFFADKRPCHTPTYSIASDLQVEVSEGGSPRLTVDDTSSVDGEYLTYDGDVEKEITSGGEEMWVASSHLSGVEENESRLKAVHAVSEEDIIEVGFAGVPVASSMQLDQVVGHDLIDTSSLSSSRTEIAQEGQAHSIDLHHKIHDKVKQVVEEIGEPQFSTTSDEFSPENLEKAKNLIEKLVAQRPHEVHSGKPEEPSYPPEKSIEEVNAIHINLPVVHANDDMEDLKLVEERDGGAQILINQDAVGNLAIPAEENSGSSEYIEGNSKKLAEHQTIMREVKLVDVGNSSKSVEEFGDDLEKLNEHRSIADTSKQFEDQEHLNLIEDSKDEQSIGEVRISGVSQSSDDPIASDAQLELVEQVPINSSSSSSPKSVLPENVTMERVPSSDFDHEMHIDVLEPNVEDMVPDGQLAENLIQTVPQNAQTLEDSIAHTTSDGDSEKLQESSSPAVGSSGEACIVYNVTQPAVDNKEDKEDFKSIETSGGESEALFSHEDISNKLTEDEAKIGSSIPAEESNNLSIPEPMVKEEKPTSPPGKSTKDANIIYSANDMVVSEKEDKEKLTSVEDSGRESQSLIRQEAVVEPPPKPAEENSSRFNEDINGTSGTLTEDEVIVGTSKSTKENESSSTIYKDTEDFELIEHVEAIHPPEANDNEGSTEATKDVEGESEILTEYEAVADPSKPDVTSDNLNIHVTAVEREEPSDPCPQKSTAEVDIIHNVNESVANEVNNVENFKSFGDTDGGSQSSIIQEVIEEPSKVSEVTNSGSIQDTEGKSKKLTEDEAIFVPSKPAEDSNNSNDIRNTEEPGKLIDRENVADQPKPGEGNDSLEDIKK